MFKKKRNYLRKIFKNFLIAWFFWKEWTQCDIYENVLGRQADATLWFYTWLVFLSWFSCVRTKPPLAGKSDIFSIYILSLLCIVVLVLSHQWQRQTAAISIWRHTWNNERKEIIHCLCCLFWFSYTFIVFRKKSIFLQHPTSSLHSPMKLWKRMRMRSYFLQDTTFLASAHFANMTLLWLHALFSTGFTISRSSLLHGDKLSCLHSTWNRKKV